jgi:hypothetical protein
MEEQSPYLALFPPFIEQKKKNRKKLPTYSGREDKPKPQSTRQGRATSCFGFCDWHCWSLGCFVIETEKRKTKLDYEWYCSIQKAQPQTGRRTQHASFVLWKNTHIEGVNSQHSARDTPFATVHWWLQRNCKMPSLPFPKQQISYRCDPTRPQHSQNVSSPKAYKEL